MKKILILILLALQLCVAGTVSAGVFIWPVECDHYEAMTSAFGYRIHPITGQPHNHSGVDLGVDYGTPISAAGPGRVVYAGWMQGFGNTVMIDHGGGLQTLYGHMDCFGGYGAGDEVSTYDCIGYVGSTGNSTGPHLHFSVLLNNEYVDPGMYVDGMEEIEAEKFGTAAGGAGGAGPGISGPTDWDGPVDVSVEISADFAKPLRDTIDGFVNLLTKAFGLIEGYILQIFICLMLIDLAMSAMYKSLSAWQGQDNNSFTNWFFYKIVFYCLMLFIITHWETFIGNLATEWFPQLGAIAVGTDLEAAGKAVSDPSGIVQKGAKLIAPVINEALRIRSVTDLFTQGLTTWTCLIFGAGLLLGFIVIGLQVCKAYLYFYFTLLFSFVSFMFSGLKQTRKYASNGINGIFAASLNLMFFVMLTVMLQFTMQNLVVGDLIMTQQTASTTGAGTKILSLEDCMQRIKGVESFGGNYHCDNGIAYGAYQILYENWDNWCSDYEANGGVLIHDGEGYERWNSYGELETAPEPNTAYPWAPQNQDAVAAYQLSGYYNDPASPSYHDWEKVCLAWNGGNSEEGIANARADGYWEMICKQKGATKTSREANLGKLIQLALLVLAFIVLGDRMMKLINKQFGGMGFKLTDAE